MVGRGVGEGMTDGKYCRRASRWLCRRYDSTALREKGSGSSSRVLRTAQASAGSYSSGQRMAKSGAGVVRKRENSCSSYS